MGRIKLVAVAALFPLVMAACANGEENGAGTDAQPEESADATVAVEDSDLGQIVVDAEGKTLYVFLADEGSDSTCYDDCEAAWPPLTVEGDPAAGEGIDASLLGTTEREDGSSTSSTVSRCAPRTTSWRCCTLSRASRSPRASSPLPCVAARCWPSARSTACGRSASPSRRGSAAAPRCTPSWPEGER